MSDQIACLPTDAGQFAVQLTAETARRDLLKTYISKGLTSGVDYGIIKGDKPCLLKPGAEKFCSLLDLQPKFSADPETAAMLPDEMRNGLFLFKCELVHRKTGQTVSEGRGCCGVKEKSGMINTALKIAEKRAQVDAVLRMGLSDVFTQDLDDMEQPPPPPPKVERNKLIEAAFEIYRRLQAEEKASDKITAWISAIEGQTDGQIIAGINKLKNIK
jgi:hypothetical protein